MYKLFCNIFTYETFVNKGTFGGLQYTGIYLQQKILNTEKPMVGL